MQRPICIKPTALGLEPHPPFPTCVCVPACMAGNTFPCPLLQFLKKHH